MKNFSTVLLYSAITAALVSARVVPEKSGVNANEIESRSIVEYSSEIPARSLRPYARDEDENKDLQQTEEDSKKGDRTKPSSALTSAPPKKGTGGKNETESRNKGNGKGSNTTLIDSGRGKNSTGGGEKKKHKEDGEENNESKDTKLTSGGKNSTEGHEKKKHKDGKNSGQHKSGQNKKNSTEGTNKKGKNEGSADLTKTGDSSNIKDKAVDSQEEEFSQDKYIGGDVERDLTGLDIAYLRNRALQLFGLRKRDDFENVDEVAQFHERD